ncbi:MAG: UDP-3-O-acyl-N-acetylglucosamine deacetylase [Synergistaceae bacterium]|jgi:UDP-3-O-[3-hydroxymyristoyl] N-acetylglucosamine deacetylase|nr:UDP-3-O-acyl-N-acetylglucosamine deacetylase [Synergistaceae bacterium]
MKRRRTTGAQLSFEGTGIHSGERSSVKILPLAEDRGICFRFGKSTYSIAEARHTETRRRTTVTFPGGETLGTVEHLLAALVGLGIDDALIEAASGSEIPILDGSALPFAQSIAEATVEKENQSDSLNLPVTVSIDGGASSVVALPSGEFRITYVTDYPGTLGTEMKDVSITPESFLRDIAPARTFGLASEAEALRSAGLARGASEDNTIIIGDDASHRERYRLDRECAAHKVLDLLGDLALAGATIRAHYICVRGGHDLHSRLVNRLRTYAGK